MTSLGREIVGETRYNTLIMVISGDLSYAINVVPKSNVDQIGLRFATKSEALKFAKKTGHLGWQRQIEIYNFKYPRFSQKYRYLPFRIARKYLKHAYGEYAEKLKKR